MTLRCSSSGEDGRARTGAARPDPRRLDGGISSVDRAVPVAADETLFLYDGVIDALGAEERFGSERLKRLLAEHAGEAPEGPPRALTAGSTVSRSAPRPMTPRGVGVGRRPFGGAGPSASHPDVSRTLPVS